jgi:hypothetical protein
MLPRIDTFAWTVTSPPWNWSVPAVPGVQSPARSPVIGWFAGTEPPLPVTWNVAVPVPLASMSAVAVQESMATGADRLRLEMCRAK